MYHVALELTQEQIKQLRLRATTCDQTVKSYVTALVKEALSTSVNSANTSSIPVKQPKNKEK